MTNSNKTNLQQYGFGDYESRAYMVLVEHQRLIASDIARLAQIPQGRVYSVLQALEKRGFCTVFPGSVKSYEAVDPNEAFEELISEKEKSLAQLSVLKTSLSKQFESRASSSDPFDFLQILTSKQSQVGKFDDLIHSTNNTLYSFNKSPYATGFKRSRKEIDAASAPLKSAIARKVEVRALFETEENDREEFIAMLEYYESIGEQVRVSEELPLKMLLVDSQKAMVSLRHKKEDRFNLTSMVIDHSDLTNALSELFELHWAAALSIKQYKMRLSKNQSV